METYEIFQQLGLALLLGLLVGLQRERAGSGLAGLRTFPLVTILGTLAALLARTYGVNILAAAFLGVVAALIIGNLHKLRVEQHEPGLTTEIAMMVMFGVGAYLAVGPWIVAIAVGGGVAVLLQFKPELHGLAARLQDEDLRAIMQFVLIAFIVLPILPDRTFGPFDVINPHDIWLMVVLIVGISLAGYLVYRFRGPGAGIIASGLLGGVISSTATTVASARRAREVSAFGRGAVVIVLIATAVVYFRVLLEVYLVGPSLFPEAAPRLGLMATVASGSSALAWLSIRREPGEMPETGQGGELKSAIAFALLYAAVLLGVATARYYLGDPGLFLAAGLSGMTDMDAITLSTSRLAERLELEPSAAWRMILIASLSNILFKAAIVGMLGSAELLRRVTPWFVLQLFLGAALILLG